MMTVSKKKLRKRFLEINENENRTQQNFWDILKAVLQWKLTVVNAHVKKSEKAETNDLMMQLKI